MDLMSGLRRTNYCGEFNLSFAGREVVVCGWTARQRDLGSLIFIDLRDRTGLVQLAFDESTDRELFKKASGVRSEYVLMAKGKVRERSSKNKELPTGDVEIYVSELLILGESETPPFEITENSETSELTRLKYRYLDLRRPDLQRNILFRHRLTKLTRDYFDEKGFIEIETPMLIKSTPEGARDFLVPSRLHKGEFYALPQSPQLYKQLSMVAGFDRYMQIARCFRDEDLRADRQPEFTQIDLELSFADTEDIMKTVEGFMQRVFRELLGIELSLPLQRLSYAEAMERYGTDKPDTRYGAELFDLSLAVKDCGFSVFEKAVSGGGSVKGINLKNGFGVLTRKEIDRLAESAKGLGAGGLSWIRLDEEGKISCSFAKFISEEKLREILSLAKAEAKDVVLIAADKDASLVLTVLGALRQEAAKKCGLIAKDKYNLLWITEFPFFEFDPETKQFNAMHHPFTAPLDECLPYLETDKAAVRAKAYDLVLNGIELASGSIRITSPKLQSRIFALLGLSSEEAYRKFGYLLDAFRYGAPPHGGIGIGLDRLCMQLVGAETLRDVTAFPKTKDACEPMTESPAAADAAQLEELGLRIDKA